MDDLTSTLYRSIVGAGKRPSYPRCTNDDGFRHGASKRGSSHRFVEHAVNRVGRLVAWKFIGGRPDQAEHDLARAPGQQVAALLAIGEDERPDIGGKLSEPQPDILVAQMCDRGGLALGGL